MELDADVICCECKSYAVSFDTAGPLPGPFDADLYYTNCDKQLVKQVLTDPELVYSICAVPGTVLVHLISNEGWTTTIIEDDIQCP